MLYKHVYVIQTHIHTYVLTSGGTSCIGGNECSINMHMYPDTQTSICTHLQAEQAALAGMKAKETRDVRGKVVKSKKKVVHTSRKMTSAQAEKAFDSYWNKLRKSYVLRKSCVFACA
jgi:hypothetical protein